ncbi:MAG: thymidylate synthase (FAD) [Richelia sp. SM1_7_0]|nr:thymidylate synthase (FAD) [Richelia sp. SM1_7_0]
MFASSKFDSLAHFENIGLFAPIKSEEKFIIKVIDASLSPQTLMYLKMHQCYSEHFVGDEPLIFSEKRCGDICVNRLLESDRGHYGILESPSITFACGYIDHDTIMQARTHRVGTSFAVQSMRYTSKQFIKASENSNLLEDVIFINKGFQKDRQGNKSLISEDVINLKKELMMICLKNYATQIDTGIPPEAARDILPHNYRQHFL